MLDGGGDPSSLASCPAAEKLGFGVRRVAAEVGVYIGWRGEQPSADYARESRPVSEFVSGAISGGRKTKLTGGSHLSARGGWRWAARAGLGRVRTRARGG